MHPAANLTLDAQKQFCLFFWELKQQFHWSTDQYANCNCFWCGIP